MLERREGLEGDDHQHARLQQRHEGFITCNQTVRVVEERERNVMRIERERVHGVSDEARDGPGQSWFLNYCQVQALS